MIERIEHFVDYLDISVRAFEQQIGVSNGLIRKAITNKSDIQSKWLNKTVDNFPQINSEWLLTGKGEMLKSDKPSNAAIEAKDSDTKAVYLYDVSASGGFGSFGGMITKTKMKNA